MTVRNREKEDEMKKLFFILAFFVIMGFPAPAQADYQIVPSSYIYIDTNDAYNYAGNTFLNWNIMYIETTGVLTNQGDLLNWFGLFSLGYIIDHGTLNNSGTFTNIGLVVDYSGSSINNTGTVNNYSTIAGEGTYWQTAGETHNDGNIIQTSIIIDEGILRGTGSISGNVTIGANATVLPGDSPGTITVDGNLFSSGDYMFEIGGLSAGEYDVLNISGDATFTGGNMEFDFINGFNAAAGNYWDFLFANSITGLDTLAFTVNGLGSGLNWEIVPITGGERLLINGTPVPEPATMLLVLFGLMGLAGIRKRFK